MRSTFPGLTPHFSSHDQLSGLRENQQVGFPGNYRWPVWLARVYSDGKTWQRNAVTIPHD